MCRWYAFLSVCCCATCCSARGCEAVESQRARGRGRRWTRDLATAWLGMAQQGIPYRNLALVSLHLPLPLPLRGTMASASTSASTLAPASASASSSAQHTQHTEYRYQLLYSKSRVTLHPTPYSRDNVPGYLALLRRQRVRQANQQGGQGSSGDAHDDGDNDGDGNDDDAAANLASSSSSSSSYAPTTPRRTAPSTATPSSAGMQRQVTLQDNCKQVLLSWFPEQLVRDRGETAKFVDVELRDAEGAMQRGETQEQELLLLHHHHQQDQSGGDEAVSVTQVVQEEATFVQPPPLSSPAELGPAQEAHRERDSPSASSDAATSSLAAPQGVSSTQSATSHEPTPTQHAFSHYLGSLYSVQVVPPTISNWYGSLRVSMRGGDTLPPLYFHDDESRSTILGVIKAGNSGTGRGGGSSTGATYPPPMNQAHVGQTPCWGGDELVQQLRKYAFVHRSVHDHRVFLLNPSPADLDIHSTPVFADNAVDRPDSRRRAAAGEPSPSSLANTSPSSRPSASSPASNRPSSDAFFPDDPFAPGYTTPYGGRRGSHAQPSVDPSGDALSTWAKSTRMSLLSRFSHITRSARTASHQILTHPAGQPYASHLPEAVQTFANAGPVGPFGAPSGEDVSDASRKAGVTEYDSARVYLAKWARLVAEEGERSKRREDLYGEAPGEVAEASLPTNEGGLGEAFQVISATAGGRNSTAMSTKRRSLQAKRRYDPISLTEWESWFDSGQDGGGVGSSGGGQGSGRPSMTFAEMKARVFSRGLAPSARRHAWPLLLGALPWDVTSDERRRYWARRTKDYEQLKSLWASSSSDSASRIRNRADVVEQRHRVRVDCLRTDRKHPMFQMGSRTDGDGGEEARERARRASAGVVGRDGQDGGGEGEGDSNKSSTVVKDGSAPSTSPLLDGLEDRGAGQGQGEDGGGRGNNTNSSSSGFPSSSTSSAASTNPHVVRLGEVLLTYTFYDTLGPDADAAWAESQRIDESELGGYVQGMSDLCAPLYVVTEGNEAETFWCFVSFMDRMVSFRAVGT